MLLEAEGFEVVGEAPDGLSAVEAVHDLQPQMVLLDVQLPDIDGFEVAARITANGSAPAVVLTSSRDVGDLGPLGDSARCAASYRSRNRLGRAPWRRCSDLLRRALWGLGRAWALFDDLALILTSNHIWSRAERSRPRAVRRLGLVGPACSHGYDPDNRVGMLMAATGFAWLVSLVGVSDIPLLFMLGQALGSLSS